jgi:pimeloyl-ACP methyl ester carboxylesterase
MEPQFLKQPDGAIAYEVTGVGPLVICSPSMGDLRQEYRFLAPRLAQAGYRVASLDVRGHGESSTRWPDYSVAGVGRDLLALARDLGASSSAPAVIIGDSMSAGAAVWSAAEAPELVAGLVLVDPFVRGDGSLPLQLLFSALLARPWGPAAWLRYYASLYPTRKPADFEAYCAALRANLSQPGRLEALRRMMAAPKTASEQRLGRVKGPALVLMGSRDPDFKHPEAEAQWVASHLNAEYTMIDGAGHYPHAEMPEVTVPLVLSFLHALESAREGAYVA